MSIAFVAVVLAILAAAVLYGWSCERARVDLMRRNEELTDQILRMQGKEAVFHPEKHRELIKVPGHFDGTLAPSRKAIDTRT